MFCKSFDLRLLITLLVSSNFAYKVLIYCAILTKTTKQDVGQSDPLKIYCIMTRKVCLFIDIISVDTRSMIM